ncbi:MAG TPA: hypothetical protein VE593_02045 [Nitrososphaeraceae archaeon]|nr:hypothetical protein [Nitrososphaeraceae archaeon]
MNSTFSAMNKRLLIAAMAIAFASTFIMFGTGGIVHSAEACPNKASTSAQDPTSSNTVNFQPRLQSPQLVSGLSA